VVGNELDYVHEALREESYPFALRAEHYLENALHAERVLLTPSCTAALELSAMLLNLRSGDEVIVPSFSFVSTASAFQRAGARIVFADVRPDTWNLDEEQALKLVTARTRAIVSVHYAGVAANWRRLKDCGLPLIEDNAHGLFARTEGRFLGTLGSAAALSFHKTKNITCGEGGALILNERAWIDRAQTVQQNGTNRAQFLRGESDSYTWVDSGSNFRISELAAAALVAQLEKHDMVQLHRRTLWERYQAALAAWALANGFQLPYVPALCVQSYHMFYMVAPNWEARSRLLAYLRSRGIQAVFHYSPLHSSPYGRECGEAPLGCPVSEDAGKRLLRLPLFTHMTSEDQNEVIDAVREFGG
jgi:dTDP-4-amino-4,6-dideoxygalactose transaminase